MFEEATDNVHHVEDMSSKSRKKTRRLVARTSYESGMHWLDGEYAAYEALRKRSSTLLSAVLVVVALAVGLLLDADTTDLSCLGKVGAVFVLVGLVLVTVTSIYVSWPVRAVYGFSPVAVWNDYSKHKDATTAYRKMGKDLEKHSKKFTKQLKPRYTAHKVALASAAVVMLGLGMEIIDVAY